ncbi:deoxyxylulose-5-phosphate synthase [Streptomyces sp. AV19]|uniref:deoxyxylulose-5-phosphate synthase n=1 Tax=Streptomyces sp. AV19 TaxID=2793068 RepID=UPI0018FEB7FD|nr:deoxyxylulose-5-phosphate synthase [Streptomyces sp. AV19]MBH1938871.1 deoxyxylulose-5-phosphate synthase [Streptomyces sp. AV19]MDG4533510.1 deoxyxylulose-5-phosphate synthase [Streptomyces sp. AV19]
MPPAKTSFVCLPCRRSYKQRFPAPYDADERSCPRCGGALIHVGAAFQPPPRRDRAGWRVLAVLLDAGVRFPMGCSTGPGYRPRTIAEVRERMAHARRMGEPFARALVREELP